MIQKEYYLPNPEGTKSFLDILAQDDSENYIVIEVKKTNQAARQAIHEILKYVNALKINKKCTNEEIIVVIASVEWKELIGPFSSFFHLSNFVVRGIQLSIDEESNVISCTEVHPQEKSTSRYISPVQKCRFFINFDSLNKGIISHKLYFEEIGIKDYLVLVLRTKNVIFYEHALYIAIQRLNKEDYILLLSKNEDLLKEIQEEIQDLDIEEYSEEQELCLLEQSLGGLGEYPKCDEMEIGYPAKLTSMLEEYNWSVDKVIRYGAFSENNLLSDKKIIEEMKGLKGSGNMVYLNEIPSTHIKRMDEIREGVSEALTFNATWKGQIFNIFDYYEKIAKKECFNLKIEIFSPDNIFFDLYSNYCGVVKPNGLPRFPKSLPRFVIEATFPTKDNIKKLYLGLIKWNGVCPDISSVVKKHYDELSMLSMFAMGMAGRDKNDDVMADMGLEYISLLRVFDTGMLKSVYMMNNYNFNKVTNSCLNYLYIHDLPNRCPLIISQVNSLFDNVVYCDPDSF